MILIKMWYQTTAERGLLVAILKYIFNKLIKNKVAILWFYVSALCVSYDSHSTQTGLMKFIKNMWQGFSMSASL